MALSEAQRDEVARLTPSVLYWMEGWGRGDEDVSDALLYLVQAASRFRPGAASLRTLVFAVLRKRYEGRGRVRRGMDFEPLDFDPPAPEPPPEAVEMPAEGLPDHLRRFGRLHFGEKLPVPEAAAACGVSRRTGFYWLGRLQKWASQRVQGGGNEG